MASRNFSHGDNETDEEFDARWVTYFNKPDIDAWELKKGRFVGLKIHLVQELFLWFSRDWFPLLK